MLNNAMHRLPCLIEAEIRMLLNGPESFTPDGSFLFGESADKRGFYLGCGMNSVGVATGGAGMALAHCIVHGNTPTDLHEADPKRYPACFNSVAALAARVPEILSMKGIYGREMFETWHKMVAMLGSGLDVTPVVTDHIDFEDFETGFNKLNAGEACKVVMRL